MPVVLGCCGESRGQRGDRFEHSEEQLCRYSVKHAGNLNAVTVLSLLHTQMVSKCQKFLNSTHSEDTRH